MKNILSKIGHDHYKSVLERSNNNVLLDCRD